jgi:uncharacterized protein (TIGR02284 family)
MERDDVFAVLDDLIEISKDGEKGFRSCAETVKNLKLRMDFAERADRCRESAAELQEIMREMGGDPTRTGATSGALRRFWANLRGTVTGMDESAILDECEHGEDAALQVYENALRQELPGDVRRVIARQHREISANHAAVRQLSGVAA